MSLNTVFFNNFLFLQTNIIYLVASSIRLILHRAMRIAGAYPKASPATKEPSEDVKQQGNSLDSHGLC